VEVGASMEDKWRCDDLWHNDVVDETVIVKED
jgi:hypothetical protein